MSFFRCPHRAAARLPARRKHPARLWMQRPAPRPVLPAQRLRPQPAVRRSLQRRPRFGRRLSPHPVQRRQTPGPHLRRAAFSARPHRAAAHGRAGLPTRPSAAAGLPAARRHPPERVRECRSAGRPAAVRRCSAAVCHPPAAVCRCPGFLHRPAGSARRSAPAARR